MNKKKVLFIANANSSHTHSWIDLIRNNNAFDVRLFGVHDTGAIYDLDLPIYTFSKNFPNTALKNGKLRRYALLYRVISKVLAKIINSDIYFLERRWLSSIINKWKPDIVHTLGLEPASYEYFKVKEKYNLKNRNAWVVTARGGPELSLGRLLGEDVKKIKPVLEACDHFIADNQNNYKYALELGLSREKICPVGIIPGTGGMHLDTNLENKIVLPSKKNRIIVFPKAYECPASKALPVFEAIKICWDKLKPCEIHMYAATPETIMWFQTLPSEIKSSCHIEYRIPRAELLKMIAKSRVTLLPSLSDGIPNTLYEAMVHKSFPIVSPLETIKEIVSDKENVLFARNLYPDEIAESLDIAMNDDVLVDNAAENNIKIIQNIADRSKIMKKICNFYLNL